MFPNVGVDQTRVFQGMPQQFSMPSNHINLMPQVGQMSYVLVPTMTLPDQSRVPAIAVNLFNRFLFILEKQVNNLQPLGYQSNGAVMPQYNSMFWDRSKVTGNMIPTKIEEHTGFGPMGNGTLLGNNRSFS